MKINLQNIKLTPAMHSLIFGLVVLVLGAVATTADAAIQYATQAGVIDWGVLLAFIGATFVVTMQGALAGYVKGHAADIKQSFADLLNEARGVPLPAVATTFSATPASPHVVIYTSPTTPAQPATVQVQQPVSAPVAAPQSQLVPPDATASMPAVTPPQG